jgi:glycosyltransferase involved in cell wall biosynthesis
MRVWFINRFYWPDEPATAQMLGDLAEALAARGWPVSVIASHPGDAQTPTVEIRHGVKIYRRRGPRWGQTSVGGKFADYLLFLVGAGWQALRSWRRGDVVVAMTDPPLLGVALWPLVALRRARLIHWTQDIYPEVAMALATRPAVRWTLGLLRGPRNFTWRHSAGCVTLGREMSGLIVRNGIAPDRVVVVPNWAPRGLGPPSAQAVQHQRNEWHLVGKFAVVYSGNLGRVHDLEPVLEVAATLRDAPDIVFLFVGTGPRHGALAAQAQGRGLANVFFFPPQPRAQLGATLAAGDLHLVTLRPGCQTVVFPSKLYGIAAVARPHRGLPAPALHRPRRMPRAGRGRRRVSSPGRRPGPRGDRLGENPRGWRRAAASQPAQRRLMDFRLFTVQSCRDALVAVCDGWLQTGSPSPFADDTKS